MGQKPEERPASALQPTLPAWLLPCRKKIALRHSLSSRMVKRRLLAGLANNLPDENARDCTALRNADLYLISPKDLGGVQFLDPCGMWHFRFSAAWAFRPDCHPRLGTQNASPLIVC